MSHAPQMGLEPEQGLGAVVVAARAESVAGLVAALHAHGAEAHLVESCDDALETCVRVRARALLVDPELESGAGLDLLRGAARADGGPVPVALCGGADDAARRRSLDAGAVAAVDPAAGDFDRLAEALAPKPAPTDEGRFSRHIDRAIFDELAAAMGPDMMDQLMDRIRIDIAEQRDAIAAAKDEPDLATIRRATHVLISVAGALGAVPLQRQAEELNALANAGRGEESREAAGRLLTEAGEVLLFVGER